jgi:hypothetical protein
MVMARSRFNDPIEPMDLANMRPERLVGLAQRVGELGAEVGDLALAQ